MVDDIILYEESQIGFDRIGDSSNPLNLGIGVLADAISCNVYEELNGEFELEMTYPIAGQLYSEIQNGRIIVAKPNPYVRPQPFRIYDITKPIDGVVTIKGQHITYDMAGMILYNYEENSIDGTGRILRYKTKTAHLQDIMDGDVVTEPGVISILNYNVFPSHNPDNPEENPFRIVLGDGWSHTPDVQEETCEFELEEPTNLRGLMGSNDTGLVKMFKGYWTFDCYNCIFSKHRGADRGVTFEYGRDITDLEVEDSMGLPYTHVMPFYKNGSDYVYYDNHELDAEHSVLIPIAAVSRQHMRILELDLTEEVKYKIDHTPDLTASFSWENLTKYNLLYLYGKAKSSNEGKARILRRSRAQSLWLNGYYTCTRFQMPTMPKLNARPDFQAPFDPNPYYRQNFSYLPEGGKWDALMWALPIGTCIYIRASQSDPVTISSQFHIDLHTSSDGGFTTTTLYASGIYVKIGGDAVNLTTTKPVDGSKNTWAMFSSGSGTVRQYCSFDNNADDPFETRKMDTDDGPQIIEDMENPTYEELYENPTVRGNWIDALFLQLASGNTESAVGGSAWFFAYQGAESGSDVELVQQALKDVADEYIVKNHVGGVKTDLKISFYEADGINNYHIELGDTVYISHPNLVGDTMAVTITRYTYDVIMGRYSQLEIGDPNQDTSLSSDISGLGSFYENTTTKKELASALTSSMKTVNGASGGCVKMINSKDNSAENPDQILIMDKPTPSESKYMWRWNYGGLMAGQKDANGIWRYGLAMTIDGRIVADRIKVGTLSGINMQFNGEDEQRRPHKFLVNGETGKVTLVNVDLVAYGTSGVDPIFQLSADGTAMMHGDLLVSGTIKADKIMDRNGELYGGIPQSKLSYDAIHSDNYSYTSGTYAASGSMFDLQNGVIRSKNFAINASGNAYFKGNVTATAGTIGGCTISGGVLKVGAANVNQVTVGTSTGRVFADLKADGTTPYVKITAKDASNNVLFQLDTTKTGTNILKVAAANITGTLTASQINTTGLVVQNLLVKDANDRVIIKTDTTGTTPVAQIFIRGTIEGEEVTIFSADSQQGTVSINGQAIDAGTVTRFKLAEDAVQSSNYQAGEIFSLAGTAMNLRTGVFQSPHFAIDASGDAYFNGNIESISSNTTIFKATPTSAVLAGFTASALSSSIKCLRTNSSLTMTSDPLPASDGVYVGTDGIRLLGHTGGGATYYDTKIGIYETTIASSMEIGRYNKILFNTLTDEVTNDWTGSQHGGLFRMWHDPSDTTFLKLYSGSGYSTDGVDTRLQVDYNGSIHSHSLSSAAAMLNVRVRSQGLFNGYSMKLENGGGTAEFNGSQLTLAGRESNTYGIVVETIYETKQSPRGIEFFNNTTNASALKTVTIPAGVNVYTPTVTDIGYMVNSYNCGVSDNVVWDGVTGKFYIKTALQAQGTVTYIPKAAGYSSCMALKTRTSTYTREVELSGRLYVTGTIVGSSSGQISSDRNVKNTIVPIEGSEYDSVLDNLVPVSFKYDDGSSGRTHFGFIAQDIAELVEGAGLSVDEFAPICIDGKGTDEERYSLRYQELIAFAFHEINKLKKEIQTLKGD